MADRLYMHRFYTADHIQMIEGFKLDRYWKIKKLTEQKPFEVCTMLSVRKWAIACVRDWPSWSNVTNIFVELFKLNRFESWIGQHWQECEVCAGCMLRANNRLVFSVVMLADIDVATKTGVDKALWSATRFLNMLWLPDIQFAWFSTIIPPCR